MIAVSQLAELWELSGLSVEFTLEFSFVNKPSPDKRDWFVQVLARDEGASIADTVADKLFAYVNLNDPADLPDYLTWGGSGQTLVSNEMKALVEGFAVPNTEFFPVKLVLRKGGMKDNDEPWEDGVSVDGFWLMNSWNRLDVIDTEKSVVEWQKSFVGERAPWITRWKRLVFTAAIEEDLFGFVHHLRRRRFISTRLRDAILQKGLRCRVSSRPTHRADR